MNNHKALQDIVVFVPEWKLLAPEDITFKRMVGITNSVFKVSHARNGV